MPWRLLFGHLRRTWFRSTLTAAGVALAVFLLCALRTVITGLHAAVTTSHAKRMVVSSAVSLFKDLPIRMEQDLKSMPGVRTVTHWTWFGGTYVDEKFMFARFSVDVPTVRRVYGDLRGGAPDIVMPTEQWEAFESERASAVVGESLASAHGWKLGDKIELEGNIRPGQYSFTLRGIYRRGSAQMDENTMFFHWRYMDEVSGRPGDVSTFILDLDPGADMGEIAREVDARFESSDHATQTLTEAAFNQQFVSMWGNVPVLLSMIGGAVLFAAFMIALNTMLLTARERRLEIGVLKALGFRDGTAALLLVAEGVIVCGMGGVLGVGAAKVVFDMIRVEVLDRMFPTFHILPETEALAMGVALFVGVVSGLVPGWIAKRMPVVTALARHG